MVGSHPVAVAKIKRFAVKIKFHNFTLLWTPTLRMKLSLCNKRFGILYRAQA